MTRTNDLLVEIGTEELPPADVRPALRQLETGVRAALRELRIDVSRVETYGTPRRLVIFCVEVATRQQPVIRTVKGPAAHVAFDREGRPTQAAIGFARSQGVSVDALKDEDVGGGRYVVASLRETGRPTARVIPQALVHVIGGITFPKTMRWGSGQARFARPVRWVLALLGSQVLRVEIAGVRAGRKTFGHRVLSTGTLPVKSSRDYFRALRSRHVILDADERQRRITTESTALAAEVHALTQLDPRLLEETVMTTEHPVALRGTFNREFLSLPQEVLVTVMQHHQKYFPVIDRQQRLQPYFIAVRDGGRRHLASVREGHEWVLQARLADARFFFDEDRTRRLEDYLPVLEGLVVQAQLGTMAEKTRRLGQLASQVAEMLHLDQQGKENLRRAALLCKADLVTHLVGEFPELQGVIGGIYSAIDGEAADVAQAIREHYRPVGAGDRPPEGTAGALLGVIDRTDTLVGALAAGLAPTGSQDPYGLRRAAQGIIEILLVHHLPLRLPPLIAAAVAGYGKASDELVAQVAEFVWQRLRAYLVDRGLRYDLVDAALAASGDAVLEAAERAYALHAFAARPEFVRLYVAFDRTSRILTAGVGAAPNPGLFEVDAERAVYEAANAVKGRVAAAIQAREFLRALEALVPLGEPVDRLFEDVLIMAPDPRVQANRLALLGLVVDVLRGVADFSKVVMSDDARKQVGTTC